MDAARTSVLRTCVRVAVIVAMSCLVLTSTAEAKHQIRSDDSTSSGEIAIIPNSASSVPSGKASSYTINFSCSGVAGSNCGTTPTITIPISLTSSYPGTPDTSTWTYSASSSLSGLIASQGYDGTGNYVIKLNSSAIETGDSDSIQFSLTPPNNTTPNGTSWSLTPTFTSDAFDDAVAPTAATGSATASANISTSKNTSDNSSFYVVGNQVIYNITAKCNSSGSTGNLYLSSGSLVDNLPAGLSFVSATPSTPTVVNNSDGSSTLTWNYSDASELPSGCSASGTGSTTYTLVTELSSTVADNTPLNNTVTFSGTPLGTSQTVSTTASKSITAITHPPSNPFGSFGKSAIGPLNIANSGFVGTYPGRWINSSNSQPSSSPGAAEGEFSVKVVYSASRAFKTGLVDPMPCLSNVSGVVYSSNTPTPPIVDAGTVGTPCGDPAFNPTIVQISAASLATAETTDNWTPTGITTTGSTVSLTRVGSAGSSNYFKVPTAYVGAVAAILLTPDQYLDDGSLSMNVWGYASGTTLVGGDVLDNTATITAYPTSGTDGPTTTTSSASLYIQGTAPQLGVYKSFGTLGAATGGTTALNLTGYLATSTPLSGPVVLTDLLPYGLTWANPPVAGGTGTAKFSVAPSQGGTSTSVTASVQDLPNYRNTGRELIRITLPAASFTSGYYVIKPPSNLIDLTVPTDATTYNNTAQEFVSGSGDATSDLCGPGTGTTAATFESSDPYDLDGDGHVNQNNCQYAASLTVPPSGGPNFQLLKTAQGDLDSGPVYPLGIANSSEGGTATYSLQWSNTGGVSLKDPVIYDILPYIGDTGVSKGQVLIPRGSQFAPVFTGVTGTLPANVTVEYSTSENPCRDEVYADNLNTTCVDDWTSTEPSDPTTVEALRFSSSGTYAAGSSFTVSFGVKVPDGYVNSVAWNSAAANAQDTAGHPQLPAEPPKVGVTAPAEPLTPTLSTQVSEAKIESGSSVTDTSTIGNTGGADSTIDWQLVGPIAPNANGSCDGLDWAGATEVDSGKLARTGDGQITTSPTMLTDSGCYSYVQTLSGSAFAHSVTSPAGDENEVVLVVTPTGLSVTKTVDPTEAVAGRPVTFTITATNSGPGPAYGVEIDDQPISDMKLLSVSTPQGSCNDSFPLKCKLGTMTAGQQIAITTKALPLVSGQVSNGVTITTTTPNTSPSDDTHKTVVVHVRVNLGLRKRALSPTVHAGHTLRFQLIVTNDTVVAATHVTVCDRLPAGLIFVSADPRAKLSSGSYCWSLARVAAHSKRTIMLTVRAPRGAGGRVVNHATLSGTDVIAKRAQATVKIIRMPPHKAPVTG